MTSLRHLLFISLSLISMVSYANELPELGDSSLHALSPKQVKKLTEEYVAELRQYADIVTDPLINDYISTLGQRLVPLKAQDKTFHFLVIKSDEINAFAGPGNYIGINSGLILASRSESELAAVLAHEVAHQTQHHLLRQIEKQKELQLPMIAGALAAIALGATVPELGEAPLMAGIAGMHQNMINFTRTHEREADRIGIKALYQAGFDPKGMAGFFEYLQQQERYRAFDVPPILLTHPVSKERIADARNRATQFKKKKYQDSLHYGLMRARLEILSTSDIAAKLQYYQKYLLEKPKDIAARYAYTLLLLKSQQPQQAAQQIKKLIVHNPDEAIFQMALAKVQLANKQDSQALKTLKNTLALYPDHYPLLAQYSRTLIDHGKTKKAERVLKQALHYYPKAPLFYGLLSRAQAKSGKTAEAYFSRAQAYALLDETDYAMSQLQTALRLTKNPYLTKKIKARLQTLARQS